LSYVFETGAYSKLLTNVNEPAIMLAVAKSSAVAKATLILVLPRAPGYLATICNFS